jgi:hypothetical protein
MRWEGWIRTHFFFRLFIQPTTYAAGDENLDHPEGQRQQDKDVERMPWNDSHSQQNDVRDVNHLGW